MKILKQLYAGLLGLAIGFISCTDDLGVQSIAVSEGMPAEVTLEIDASTLGKVQVTRAGEDEGNYVYDLYILIFNKNKVLKTKEYISNANFEGSKTLEPIQTTSGESYIMAVANIKRGMPSEYDDDVTGASTALDEAEIGSFTIDDLRKLQLGLRARTVDVINRQNGTFTMAGAYVPSEGQEQGDGYCQIPEEKVTLPGSIKLYRTDAWITFNLSIGEDANKPSNASYEPSFIATSFRVLNIPMKSSLTNQTTDYDGAEVTSSEDYYDIPEDNPVTIADEVTDDEGNVYQTFSFYLMENRKSPVSIPENGWTYECREKQVKTSTGEGNNVINGDWEYAPKYATYVAISGRFRGYDEDDRPVEADVIYKIHLGDFRNNDYGNFDTRRNTHYTYTVKVNGVDNIIVEVETNDENQPGATGDVFYSDNTRIYYLDAHYEACLMEFSYEDLSGNYRDKINYLVSTPFTEYGAIKSSDANWVRFAINDKSAGNYNRTLQVYENPNQMMNVEELIDLLNKMSQDRDHEYWDNNERFAVTCFVNEYYYTEDPAEDGYQSDHDYGGQYAIPEGVTLDKTVPAWKYVVNQPNRTLSLLCDVNTSADGESSIINAAYVISQRSIQTFYNADPSVTDLTSALGLEVINETGTQLNEMGEPEGTTSSDYRDGWNNSVNMWNAVGKNWSKFINYAANGYTDYTKTMAVTDETVDYVGLQSDYQKAYIACLQRNRDVNGNGTIDADELKWYLPALNQYGAIFMGAGALSAEARLYQDADWHLKHYFSSTYDTKNANGKNQYDVMTVWAEEGFSISNAFQADTWAGNNANQIRRVYRCVRNIGNIKLDGQDYESGRRRPQNYWFQDETNKHLIRFTYMNPNALRSIASEEELSGTHNQNDYENRVYSGFEYASSDTDDEYTQLAIRRSGTDICSSYEQDGYQWRIPNHRELLFMTLNGQNQPSDIGMLPDFPTRIGNSYPRTYGCRTLFRWATTPTSKGLTSPLDGDPRYGYRVEANGNMSLTDTWNGGGEESYVRCVRDVIE